MPSIAMLEERNAAPIDRSLFERVRENGRVAARMADKLPSIVAHAGLSEEALAELVLGIEARRVESKQLVFDAEDGESERLLVLARNIENVWDRLARLAAARQQTATRV